MLTRSALPSVVATTPDPDEQTLKAPPSSSPVPPSPPTTPTSGAEQLAEAQRRRKEGTPAPTDDTAITGEEETVV